MLCAPESSKCGSNVLKSDQSRTRSCESSRIRSPPVRGQPSRAEFDLCPNPMRVLRWQAPFRIWNFKCLSGMKRPVQIVQHRMREDDEVGAVLTRTEIRTYSERNIELWSVARCNLCCSNFIRTHKAGVCDAIQTGYLLQVSRSWNVTNGIDLGRDRQR